MNQDLSDYIPDEFFSSQTVSMFLEHSLPYLGRESLQALATYWHRIDTSYSEAGISSDSIVQRLNLVSEAQECRKKSDYLARLAAHAESKPQLFHSTMFREGERVTCFFQEPPKIAQELVSGTHFYKAIVAKVIKNAGTVMYRLNLRDKSGEITNRQISFVSDHVSIFPTEDYQYLKFHPNFFRFYLKLRARTESEHQKIDQIISAL